MINIGGQKNDESYRYKMPAIKAKREGRGNGIKTVFVNAIEISKCINVDPIYPTKFFGIELCSNSSYSKKTEKCVVNGNHSEETLQKILHKFIQKFILCDKCKLPETCILVDKKREKAIKKCAACGVKTKVDPSHRLTAFILKNPPSYKKSSLKAKKTETKEKTVDSNDSAEIAETNLTAPAKLTNESTTSILKDMLDEGASTVELLAEVGRMELASPAGKVLGKVVISQGIIDAIFGDKNAKQILADVDRHKKFLVAFVADDERNGAGLADALEEFVTNKRPELMRFVPMIFEKFYDCDVLTEEMIIAWYEKDDEGGNVRLNSKVFIDWLKNAENESDDN